MQAFILISLTDIASYSFEQPILEEVKELKAADLMVLDIDAFSDEMLVNHVCRLIHEAETFVVYFKVEKENAPLGASLKIVEELIRQAKTGLILLEGKHQRLKTILQSRPHLVVKDAETPAELKPLLVSFLMQVP